MDRDNSSDDDDDDGSRKVRVRGVLQDDAADELQRVELQKLVNIIQTLDTSAVPLAPAFEKCCASLEALIHLSTERSNRLNDLIAQGEENRQVRASYVISPARAYY